MTDNIREKAKDIEARLIDIRRDIHAHPEIGFEVERTADLVADELQKLGMEVRKQVGISGVIGTLRGKHPGKTILLRADMDCLPIEEENDVPYRSKHEGLMHACAHDAHTTWLLGAAMILADYKEQLHGNVKFLFQPAEELGGGALKMYEDGALDNPKVDAAIGFHVWPTMDAGKIGVRYGALCAAPDCFKLIIKGKGGHGAQPDKCIDPITVACQVQLGLQNIVSRVVSPTEPLVITTAKINAGTSYNIIPAEVTMEGTVRTHDKQLREDIPHMMERVIKGITDAYGATYTFDFIPYYPSLFNDHGLTKVVEDAAIKVMGQEHVIQIDKPTMGGEDFTYLLDNIPGSFFIVGTYNEEKGITSPLHSSTFNIDETILKDASATLTQLVLDYLQEA
ncbi:amidohydrolase [Vallitalea pronyensis]|uniref:Amidohydrolase n=1 Tax=Vallitalea pronyensis TaxID=1348613 RepID=A0A8J8MPK0_9FIRM|nr:amidohydrolase [Vallitalea pronyensis]QUI25038.1 amidohydrolase [Vallitalea pronyensis]